jgi:hypothetical protein
VAADENHSTQETSQEYADRESRRTQTLDDRFGKIEQEQDRQGGILERIEAALSGSPVKAAGAADEPAGVSVAEQVRQGVAKIQADKDAAEQAQADSDQRARQIAAEVIAEQRPDEPVPTRAQKWQARLYGKADKR